MSVAFNATFVTEIILKLLEWNHSAKIHAKCHLTDKLLNYNFILGKHVLHQLGIILNFENDKTITWPEVSISMITSNGRAKEFFVIKESRPVGNVTKRINIFYMQNIRKLI